MKITSLTKMQQILMNITLPDEQFGSVGKFVEDQFEQYGYSVNRGAGCDLNIANTGIEIKTRNILASSAQTIGSMLPSDIVKIPYDMSPIKAKFQQQFRVHYNNTTNKVVSAKMYDFRAEFYQGIIREGYEEARKIFASNNYNSYVCGKGQRCYFEKTSTDTNSYDFRMRSDLMEGFERTHNSTFGNMFSYE